MSKSHANFKEKTKYFRYTINTKDMFKLIGLEDFNDI
jgi:hypothetical protein